MLNIFIDVLYIYGVSSIINKRCKDSPEESEADYPEQAA